MNADVALITTSYPRYVGDPAGHFVQSEAKRLVEAGHRVIVWAPGPGTVIRDNPEVRWLDGGDCFGAPGVLARLRERPTRVIGASQFIAHARRALKEQQASLHKVVAHFLVPCAWPIAFDVAAPLEVVAHGSDVELLVRLRLARYVVARLLDRGARFRFVSERLRDDLACHSSPALLESSDVAASPIDIAEAPSRALARERLCIEDRRRVIVICGRLIAQKRIDAAIHHALRDDRAARIVVIGDGPERARLARHFPECDFVGHVERPRALEWIAAADLLVSASHHEGAPTVIREARALGVPVLAEPCADLVEWAASDAGIRLVREFESG